MSKHERRSENFYKFIEKESIKNRDIVEKTGLTRGYISNVVTKKVAPSDKLLDLMEHVYGIDFLDLSKATVKNVLLNDTKGVPYFDNIDGTASITTSFSDYPETPAFYIDYEHFNDCDAYIQVVGDSMYPAYSSGEIIAVKRIYNLDVIQWGEVYFVVTNSNANDMKTVKQLHYHEDLDKIVLRSSNPNYKGDTVVNKKDILYLYIVKGKIRRNQL